MWTGRAGSCGAGHSAAAAPPHGGGGSGASAARGARRRCAHRAARRRGVRRGRGGVRTLHPGCASPSRRPLCTALCSSPSCGPATDFALPAMADENRRSMCSAVSSPSLSPGAVIQELAALRYARDPVRPLPFQNASVAARSAPAAPARQQEQEGIFQSKGPGRAAQRSGGTRHKPGSDARHVMDATLRAAQAARRAVLRR